MEATIDIRTADGNVNILLDDAKIGSLREVLVELCLSTMAQFAMLIDAAGRVVACGGETKDVELEAVAALSAADLATSRQLAAMLGEPEFSLLFQHEKQKNLFMTAIESDAILIVVFDVDTTFGALRLRIRRSISKLQQVLHQAKRNTVVALSTAGDLVSSEPPKLVPPPRPAKPAEVPVAESPRPVAKAPPPEPAPSPPAAKAAPVSGPAGLSPPSAPPVAPPSAAAAGLPSELAEEIRKALTWFDNFQGWKILFEDEIAYLKRGLERGNAADAEKIRSTFLRTRARLTEQKRLLEARFRLIQSLYQQFVATLQGVMRGAWRAEVVDRAMQAAFSSVGTDHNLVGKGVQKREDNWGFDFVSIGRQLVTVCHHRNWSYQQGMTELLHQLNAALAALSAFVIEDRKLQEELTKQWARLFKHYADGLKTLELEPHVLDLFRPLMRPGALPKV